MKTFRVQERAALRDFTDSVYPQGSFAFSRLLREKEIRVNGKKTGQNVLLFPGDEVAYYTTPREEALPFYDTVYEDENLLVADKYAGVNSEALFYVLHEEKGARFIHRLDRNTRGLICFAKNAAAEEALSDAFRLRRAEKIYEAVCCHPFSRPSALLTAYLKKDAAKARVRVFSSPCAGAEKIVTEYFGAENRGELARVQVRLHSGKTHQIRAHLAFCGHPVLGDEKYGDAVFNKKYRAARQELVAKKLSFAAEGMLAYLGGKMFESSFSARFPASK